MKTQKGREIYDDFVKSKQHESVPVEPDISPRQLSLFPRIRSTRRFALEKKDVENGGGISLTVPDDAYTIRELLEKFTNGVDPSVSKTPIYPENDADFDDADLEEVNRMDIQERDEYRNSISEKINSLNSNLKSQRTERAKKEKERKNLGASENQNKNDDSSSKKIIKSYKYENDDARPGPDRLPKPEPVERSRRRSEADDAENE